MDLAGTVALRLKVESLGRGIVETPSDEGVIISNSYVRTSDVSRSDA
jgi:hypothetical protein